MSLEPQDRAFLEQLQQAGESTIQQICAVTGVTATAIRTRLVRLEGKGFVTRETVREGRGRPRHVYAVSTDGQRALGDNYRGLAIVLWNEIANLEDSEFKENLLNNIKQAMVSRYKSGADSRTMFEKFIDLRNVLSNQGFEVSVNEKGDLPVLREKQCPYLDLAHHGMSICDLEVAVYEDVLGTSIERTTCFRDGGNACEFQPAGNDS